MYNFRAKGERVTELCVLACDLLPSVASGLRPALQKLFLCSPKCLVNDKHVHTVKMGRWHWRAMEMTQVREVLAGQS